MFGFRILTVSGILNSGFYLLIYLFIYLPAFLDSGLPRGNVHELDLGAIPSQSHNRSVKVDHTTEVYTTTPTLFE